MARRQRNRSALAGLAALGALGYISGKGPLGGLYKRREGDPAPVQDGVTASQASASRARASADSDYQPSTGFMEQGFYSPAPSPDYVPLGAGNMEAGLYGPQADVGGVGRVDVAAAAPSVDPTVFEGYGVNEVGRRARPSAGPAVRPAASGARPSSGQGAGAGAGAGANRADLRGYDDMYANRPPAAPVIGPRDTGVGGATAAELEAYDRQEIANAYADPSRRKDVLGQGGARRNVSSAARQYNQDDQGNRAGTQADGGPPIARGSQQNTRGGIPGQSAVAPQGGQRVSGTDLSRNLANALMALGPTRLAGFGNAAVEGATARAAAQRAAVLRAERAEAARRGQTPTTLTSTRPNDATKRTRKFNEEDSGVEFKRGGKTKKMASGGMTSASKRGDGIASKGKTKCKMY